MDAISHAKRLEVARYFLLGYTYAEIEKKSGISHGSVANVVKELKTGQLTIPGVASDEVDDLRQLSFELAKKGLEPSQAQLGITLFERFTKLGVAPSQVDKWSKLINIFAPDNFPAKDFFEAALKLHKLEEAEGTPFEEVAGKYAGLKDKTGELESQADSLDKKNNDLSMKVKSLTSEVNALKNEKEELKVSAQAESAKLEEAKTMVAAAKEEGSKLKKEIGDLKKMKIQLCSEVDGKEKSLTKLEEMGFSEEDLLHLRNLVEGMAEKVGDSAGQIKDKFFSALGYFGDSYGIQKAAHEEAAALQKMLEQKSSVAGEIAALENRRAALQGEISEGASAATKQMQVASEEAVSMIRQETDAIREEVKSILEDTLVAGLAVGEMRTLQKKGEESGKELEELVGEVKRRLGGSR